jgi:hypothetical protein
MVLIAEKAKYVVTAVGVMGEVVVTQVVAPVMVDAMVADMVESRLLVAIAVPENIEKFKVSVRTTTMLLISVMGSLVVSISG